MFLQKLLLGLLSVGSVALPATPQMVAQPPDDTDYLDRYSLYHFTLGTNYFLNGDHYADLTFLGNSYRTGLPSGSAYIFSSTYRLPSSAMSSFFGGVNPLMLTLFDDIVLNISLYSDNANFSPGVVSTLEYEWHYRVWFHIKNSAKLVFNEDSGYYEGIKYFNMIPSSDHVAPSSAFDYSSFFYGDRVDLSNALSVSNLGFSGSNRVYCASPSFALFPWSYPNEVWWSPIGTYVDVSGGYDVHFGDRVWSVFADGSDTRYVYDEPLPVDSYVTKIHNAVMVGNTSFLSSLNLFGFWGENNENLTCHFLSTIQSYIGSIPDYYFYFYNLLLRNVSSTMEVVPIWGLFSMILSMPFTFVFQAFNITLFQGTIYEFPVGSFVYSMFGIMILLGVFGLIFSFIRGK